MKPPAHILLSKHLKELGLEYLEEHRFHDTRLWRLDFYLPEHRIGIELQGGFYRGKGGHNSINGMQRDMEKGNAATMAGIRLLHFSSADVLRGKAREFLEVNLAKP